MKIYNWGTKFGKFIQAKLMINLYYMRISKKKLEIQAAIMSRNLFELRHFYMNLDKNTKLARREKNNLVSIGKKV